MIIKYLKHEWLLQIQHNNLIFTYRILILHLNKGLSNILTRNITNWLFNNHNVLQQDYHRYFRPMITTSSYKILIITQLTMVKYNMRTITQASLHSNGWQVGLLDFMAGLDDLFVYLSKLSVQENVSKLITLKSKIQVFLVLEC